MTCRQRDELFTTTCKYCIGGDYKRVDPLFGELREGGVNLATG